MKRSAESKNARKVLADFRRHLSGWQAAAVVVGMALCAAVLVTPRRASPIDLPLPRIDRREQLDEIRREEELGAKAEREGLPFAVRAVGEQIRRIGKAASGSPTTADAELTELRRLVRVARKAHGDAPLLALRAVQGRMFSAAVGRWLSSGVVSEELRELGGNFPELSLAKGWTRPGVLRAAEGDLSALYRVRWTVLTHLLSQRPFAPSLNEWRAYFRLRLSHPLASTASRDDLLGHLEDVLALSAKDDDYPERLGQGVLLFYLEQYPESMAAFRQHLAETGHGPWTLHARSALAEAARRASQPEGPEVW